MAILLVPSTGRATPFDLAGTDWEGATELVRLARADETDVSADAIAAVDRLEALGRRLGRLVERGSGLSDRYADDLD